MKTNSALTLALSPRRGEAILRWFTILAICVCGCLSLRAQSTTNYVTAVITFTNQTVTGNAIRINGQTRFYTNSTGPLTILTNGTAAGSATNTFSALSGNKPPAPIPFLSQTSSVTLTLYGQGLTCSITGNFGSLLLITNVDGTNSWTQTLPYDGLPLVDRTNNASEQVYGFKYSSTSIQTGIVAMSKFADLTTDQTLTHKRLTAPAISGGTLSNVTPTLLTGGYWLSGILDGPVFSNAVNYGSAFSSPGTGFGSEQFGNGAQATADGATALGTVSVASGTNSTAIGGGAQATGTDSTALGATSFAPGDGASALGTASTASGTNSTAVGANASATHVNSTAIGYNAGTTADNQVMLGSSAVSAHVSNVLEVGGSITNGTYSGTNQWVGDIAVPWVTMSGLANTNNVLDPGNAINLDLTGPTANFNVTGILHGRPGREINLRNKSGFSIRISFGSGTTGATNRFDTGTGMDVVSTNQPAHIRLIYGTDRWEVRTASN